MKNWTDIPEPSLDPPEPEIVGHCPVCGEEIYKGNTVRIDELHGLKIHPECMFEYITSELGKDLIVDLLGYEVGVA